jgi:Xaa-Pro aminopeptidase
MNNIARIQEKLVEKDLDAVLITDEKNQRYAAGFPFTDGLVLVTRTEAFLLTDSRYIEAARNTVPEFVQTLLFGRDKKLLPMLMELIREKDIRKLGAEEQKLSYALYRRYEALLGMEFVPAQCVFDELRPSKTADEIDCMIKAQRIAEKALDDVLGIIKPGMTEREIAAELNYRMMKYGAEGNSFDTICITGKKTSMPHGVPGDEKVQPGDFITMDFGCLKYGYCSDMTRTVAVGHATDEMRKVYGIVLEAQLAGIAAARAGVTGGEIDAAARKVIDDAGYGEYFGHSFGHSLGLDIHELPGAVPGSEAVMPEGAMVSAEPGIYMPGKFGVRIEDVMILRKGGSEDITRAPKELIIL